MITNTILAHRKNYGSKRNLSDIRYIVIHYTANDGDTDINNGNYFKNNIVYASAHYFVSDDSITISVPEDYVAYHCGAKFYYHPYCRNTNSIGIEICDNNKNGAVYPTQRTIDNTITLTKKLMKKFNIPKENVIRHYDVSHKLCPMYWTDDHKWIHEFWNKLSEENDMKYYETLEEIPSGEFQETISDLISKGIIKGTGTGLHLSEDMVRLLVYLRRANKI